MDVKTYLSQGIWLDERINYNIRRLEQMKAGIDGIRSPQLGSKCASYSPDGDPPYVKIILHMNELNEQINQETDMLFELKKQIERTIRTAGSEKLEMVLSYRYLDCLKWEEIGNKLHAGRTTLKRWHNEALERIQMPENPIIVRFHNNPA